MANDGSTDVSTDRTAWYHFHPTPNQETAVFIRRRSRNPANFMFTRSAGQPLDAFDWDTLGKKSALSVYLQSFLSGGQFCAAADLALCRTIDGYIVPGSTMSRNVLGSEREVDLHEGDMPPPPLFSQLQTQKSKITCLPVHSATGFMMAGSGMSMCSPASPRYVATRQNVWGFPQHKAACVQRKEAQKMTAREDGSTTEASSGSSRSFSFSRTGEVWTGTNRTCPRFSGCYYPRVLLVTGGKRQSTPASSASRKSRQHNQISPHVAKEPSQP